MTEQRAAVWVQPGLRSGEPCIYGTRTPTAMIAALARDGADVKGMYPWLNDAQIEVACWYEDTYTKRRKRKATA